MRVGLHQILPTDTMLKKLFFLSALTLIVLSLPACNKKAKEEKTNLQPQTAKTVQRPRRTRKLKDSLSGLEAEDRQAALKLYKEEHKEQKKNEDEFTEEGAVGFFPVSDGARQMIENAALILRRGASSDEKIAALENLEGIDHPDILPTIELALDDKDPVVREVALNTIMNINSPEVVPVVIKALDDPEPDLRLVALDALMDVKGASVNEALEKALKDDVEEVREGVVDLLFIMESPDALPSVKLAMSDSSPEIREGAMMCMEDFHSKEAVDTLIYDGLLSDYEDVRDASKDALEFLTDQEFETYEQAKDWWQKNRTTFEFDF